MPAARRWFAPIRSRSSGRAGGRARRRRSRRAAQAVRRQLDLQPDVRLGVGVDRMDYTKGIDEKFLAVERLLESRPEFSERFVFVQIAEPSRDCLPAYRDLRVEAADDGGTHQRAIWRRHATVPSSCSRRTMSPRRSTDFLRAADLCYVGSLHDGMNLVAKEFVSARDDERGVLILSRFTGAARQLAGALIVNPYAIDDSAHVPGRGIEHARPGTVAPHARACGPWSRSSTPTGGPDRCCRTRRDCGVMRVAATVLSRNAGWTNKIPA